MKRRWVLFTGILLLLGAHAAFAFGFSDIKEYITGELLTILGGIGLGILHRLNASRYSLIVKTLSETGQFLTTIGDAAADTKVTREELAAMIKEGADVVKPFMKTPDKYVDPFGKQ